MQNLLRKIRETLYNVYLLSFDPAVQDERGPRKSTIEKRAALRQNKGESKPKITFQPWREDTPPPNEVTASTASAMQTMQHFSSSPNSTSSLSSKQSPISTNVQTNSFSKTAQYSFIPAPPLPATPRMTFASPGVPANASTIPVSSTPSNNNPMFGYANPAALLQASMFLQAMRPIRLPSFGFFGQQLPNIAPAFLGNRTGKLFYIKF